MSLWIYLNALSLPDYLFSGCYEQKETKLGEKYWSFPHGTTKSLKKMNFFCFVFLSIKWPFRLSRFSMLGIIEKRRIRAAIVMRTCYLDIDPFAQRGTLRGIYTEAAWYFRDFGMLQTPFRMQWRLLSPEGLFLVLLPGVITLQITISITLPLIVNDSSIGLHLSFAEY